MSATLCLHHQYGHCKFGVHCRNQHITETCANFPCVTTKCSKRHPKVCKFFSISGSCRFKESCSYLHKRVENDKIYALNKEVEKLKEDIELLTTEVKKLQESLSKSVSKPSIAFDNASTSSTTSCLDAIPQLDGLHQDFIHDLPHQTSQQPLQCETCGKVFRNSDEFKKHDSLQFCCDDCGICYATQLQADLHVLQVHPDETYARNFIPASTKLLFAQQNSAVS